VPITVLYRQNSEIAIVLQLGTVRFHIKERSFWLTHCHQKCARKEIYGSGFLDVNQYILVHPIKLRRGFLRCVNISIHIFDDNVSFPGLYGGLYGQNLPYKFKNLYGDFPVRSETGYVILSKFWSRFVLRQRRNQIFLVDSQGCLSEQTVIAFSLF
jgi:hypothetical protein